MKSLRSIVLMLSLMLLNSASNAQVNSPDYTILRAIANTRTEFWNKFFIVVSDLNNPLCLLVVLVLLLERWLMKDRKYFRAGLLVGQSLIFSQSITFLIKDLIGRLRPHLFDTTFASVISANNKSFPSGHTSEAFTVAFALWYAFPSWWVRVPAMAWAFLVAYARMYLGIHYPSDIVGGIVVGALCVWLVIYLMKGWQSRRDRRSKFV